MSSFMSYLVSSLGKLTEKILINLRTKNKQYSKSLGSIVMNCWVGCDVQERSAIEVMVIKPIIENAILGETPTLSKNSKSFLILLKKKEGKRKLVRLLCICLNQLFLGTFMLQMPLFAIMQHYSSFSCFHCNHHHLVQKGIFNY